MDLLTAIKERRSCRNYLPDPLDDETIRTLLESAVWAPSPANNQPWEFIVITSPEVKESIFAEAQERRKILFEKSGWKWLNRYEVDFLKTAPVIVAVVGDPEKTGADMFLDEGYKAYQHACAAAIQNMLLTAHSLELGSLWFTLFDKSAMRRILGVPAEKDPIALICLGKPGGSSFQTPRKDIAEKTTYLR
ncbi:MAG: nitroreductase family protein [Desulfomonilaceae bacterium]|nr:nitroreductase family protein [Desulfomonilaceae bacterium]